MFQVFISYSWQKEDDRKLVAEAIKDIAGLEVIVDESLVDYGDKNLWIKIRDALGVSDLIVVKV